MVSVISCLAVMKAFNRQFVTGVTVVTTKAGEKLVLLT